MKGRDTCEREGRRRGKGNKRYFDIIFLSSCRPVMNCLVLYWEVVTTLSIH